MSSSTTSSLYRYFSLEKNKIVWCGTFEELKEFVQDIINEEEGSSTWKSPGGGTWTFTSQTFGVTWHIKSQSIRFEGVKGEELLERIRIYLNGGKEVEHNCGKYEIDMAELKLDVTMLWATVNQMQEKLSDEPRSDADQTKSPAVNDSDMKALQEENRKLKVQNETLNELIKTREATWLVDDRRWSSSNNTAKPNLTTRHIATQTEIFTSHPQQDDNLELKSNAEALFDCQLKSYRLASHEKFAMRANQRNQKNMDININDSQNEIKSKNANDHDHLDDLKQKLSETEHERDSLRTAIKIIRDDFLQAPNQAQESKKAQHQWQVKKPKTKKPKSKVDSNNKSKPTTSQSQDINLIREQSAQVSTSNQFSALVDQVNHINRTNADEIDQTDEVIMRNDIDKECGCPTQTGNKSKSQGDKKQREDDKFTVILGDSLLKELHHDKIARSTHSKVSIGCFRGATTNEMKDYMKPTLRKKPNNIILHVGTNDTSRRKASEIMAGIDELCRQIKTDLPEAHVTISELITRDDDPRAKERVIEVNNEIRKYCHQNNEVGLLNHNNINEKALNGSKLHLNKSGTALLAKNIINYLNSF